MTAGLSPIEAPGALVLILGSFPGEQSLAARRYYAHGQNRFWPTMATVCGFDPSVPYGERLGALRESRIALWDVLRACERRGSMDHAIVRDSEIPNDFSALFARQPCLRAVCFNGRAAAALFSRHVVPEGHWEGTGLAFVTLPSTSPAHAALRPPQLAGRWRDAILPFLSSSASAPRDD